MNPELAKVIDAWQRQIKSARERGLDVKCLLVNTIDFTHWWRALGRPRDATMGAYKFGGVDVVESPVVGRGEANILLDTVAA